jgi:hypothetical protein
MGTALGFLLVRTYDSRPRLWMEKLETRRLFSVAADAVMLNDQNQPVATAEVINGVLTVKTTDGSDEVMVGTDYDTNQIYVDVNYVRKYFPRSGMTAISVDLLGGDDYYSSYNFNGLVNLPVTVNGGAGDDAIGGEYERDYIDHIIPAATGDGPYASVNLIGGEGNDTLVGGIGEAMLDGGPGLNDLRGNPGRFTIVEAPAPQTSDSDIIQAVFAPVNTLPQIAQTPGNSLLDSQTPVLGQRDDQLWN